MDSGKLGLMLKGMRHGFYFSDSYRKSCLCKKESFAIINRFLLIWMVTKYQAKKQCIELQNSALFIGDLHSVNPIFIFLSERREKCLNRCNAYFGSKKLKCALRRTNHFGQYFF
ncbi:MAG: hypothetical protein UW81_C0005G0021 [Candidatus Giovannonibacteria bacterium GW2011_GWC2_44_9]|uniref:Uncharacterized protein n=3 Tax=Candidatus Giovannoniibacteriota TaxID=1752738 RepID=A0A0G1IYJ3_9BACT|nr:MAG: hypothetical protein UW49_C0007G0064 [Candidatus Giovannonibacteria bacterium GW2011_GWB1_44_23]KKT64068.1 MAG: hypothetical protein UW57_C0003G0062 [Candidatus Giovannonibacteria bacterium GW2011_GWA1_44_29]KKT84192.1 MAG: hypothetical protein UW81_C0005G0021 [Candidatus Giovannonibacteria bacterium GW2011_GWC2_44_9]KKT91916.1 MAG: hypothetical protein UW93_C0002G0063 [Parcubacteria group bacterium GW2011_GWC1_45_13]